MKFFTSIAWILLAACLTACNVIPPQAMTHSPQFEPVYPIQKVQTPIATGAIYVGRQSDSWFGKGRNFQVGDVITVLLNESTQAARSQVGSISRNSTNDMLTPGLAVLGNKLGGVMKGTDFSKTDISNKGTGTADQTASLNGSIAVAVVEVMPNGNLVLRGEKQLALTEGSEVSCAQQHSSIASFGQRTNCLSRLWRLGQCNPRRLGHQCTSQTLALLTILHSLD